MSSFNIIVEDSSPLITYTPPGAWIDTPPDDPFVSSYSGSSYHIASEPGATATIFFNGTGLSMFGGKRPNYGTYILVVDGETIMTGTSQALSGNITRQLLGTASGLSYGPHTAVLTNINGAPVDIDWVEFETQLSSAGVVQNSTIDNTNPFISYMPPASWQEPATSAVYYNGTLSYSEVPGASALYVFSGNAVAVYGTMSPERADFVVTIDGESQTIPGGANGFASSNHTETLLYFQNDLTGEANHILTLSADPQSSIPYIDLDAIMVYTTTVSNNDSGTVSSQLPLSTIGAMVPGSTPSSLSTSAFSESSSATLRPSVGVIVGAVIGGLVILLIVLGTICFVLRWRRTNAATIDASMVPVSPVLPMQEDPKAEDLKTPTLHMQSMPMDLEKGLSFPPTARTGPSMRYSMASSVYSDEDVAHSHDGSSKASLIPSRSIVTASLEVLPRLNIPRPPTASRKAVLRISGSSFHHVPARPSKRPPTFDFTEMDK